MKSTIFIILTVLISCCIYGQDTIYLNHKMQKALKNEANYYKIDSSNIKQSPYYERIYLLDGKLKYKSIYNNNKKNKLIKHSVWYDSGKAYKEINYKNGKKNGKFRVFWENGNLKRQDYYKKGKLIEGTCWDKNGNQISYFDYEKQPIFPGGSKELSQYFKNYFLNNNISNLNIVVQFYINRDGKVTETKFIKKSNDSIKDLIVLAAF